MEIFLAIRTRHGGLSGFVTADFLHLTASEVMEFVAQGALGGLVLVRRGGSVFLRTSRNSYTSDNLSSKAVDGSALSEKIKTPNPKNTPKVALYVNLYGQFLEKLHSDTQLVYLDKVARITIAAVIERIAPLKKSIIEAAKKNDVDPNLVAAIMIDEYARMGPDDLLDLLAKIGVDTTVGLPQMRMSTAREMIDLRLVNLKKSISNDDLFEALQNDKYAAEFVAAYLRNITDIRKRKDRKITPEILATCYSSGPSKSSSEPRGDQIAGSLSSLAVEIIFK